MFLDFDRQSPLIYTFDRNFQNLNQKFRENLFGGLVNVYARDVTTKDSPNLPFNATHTPNGAKITSILALDFTSMQRIF